MNQSYETQLQVVQRALSDVVLPALAGAEKHVIEQLQLSMAALGFLQHRLPHARRYYRWQLSAYLDLAEAVVVLVANDTLSQLTQENRTLLQKPEAVDADYVAATRALREAIARQIVVSEGMPHEAALDALILDKSAPILLQDRLWCLRLGFELKPEALPTALWEQY
jgi:hypothetical protein